MGVAALLGGGLILLLALCVGRMMPSAKPGMGPSQWGGVAFLTFFGLFLLAVAWNAFMNEPDATYTFSGPDGRLVAQTGQQREVVRLADIDAAHVKAGGDTSREGNWADCFAVMLTLRGGSGEMYVSQGRGNDRAGAEAGAEAINQFLDAHRRAPTSAHRGADPR
jgi:hypothetical protein